MSALRRGLPERFRGRLYTAILVGSAVSASVLMFLLAPTNGDARTAVVLDLGSADQATKALTYGPVDRNVDGFVVAARSSGSVYITLPFAALPKSERAVVDITAYGQSGMVVRADLLGKGKASEVGSLASAATGRTFDVTEAVRSGRNVLRVEVDHSSAGGPALFLDRIELVRASGEAGSDAPFWFVALWVALMAVAILRLAGWLGRHWHLPLLLGISAGLLWEPLGDLALKALEPSVTPFADAVDRATWFGLETGLLSGSYGDLSPLAVQLAHLVSPLTGTGSSGVRSAAVLVAVLALIVIYVAGVRVSGRVAGAVAIGAAMLSDAFRDGAISGGALPALVVAGALLLLAIHVCLARAGRIEAVLLGAAGAVVTLADPLWLAGVTVAVAVLVAIQGQRPERLRVLAVALLTLVVLVLPNRVSTAHQSGGDLFADVGDRATAARTIELQERLPAPRRGVSQPPAERVGLGGFIFGDHSLSVVVGGTLSGLYDGFEAASERGNTRLAGLVAFTIAILGALYLLIVPRLRLLVLLPVLVAASTFFIASRGAISPYIAGAPLWPALFVAGGVLVSIVVKEVPVSKALAERRFRLGRRSATSGRRG